jgi:hypothetical protein
MRNSRRSTPINLSMPRLLGPDIPFVLARLYGFPRICKYKTSYVEFSGLSFAINEITIKTNINLFCSNKDK